MKVVKKELYIAAYGQEKKFRIIKWIIILSICALLLSTIGLWNLIKAILVMFIVSLGVHFYYRHKTKSWTEDWGGYKSFKTPYDN